MNMAAPAAPQAPAAIAGCHEHDVIRRQGSVSVAAHDLLADEVAVALVYNGLSHVVMMASPLALDDFALGFSLSEGVINNASQIYGLDIVPSCNGIEVQIELASECFAGLKARRRNLAGRTGCGLCGAESLQQAISAPKAVTPAALPSAAAIETALQQLGEHQALQALTGAVHGAALCDANGAIVLLREDVGRHNALDKLIGAIVGAPESTTRQLIGQSAVAQPDDRSGFALISSRASYEMVSKCCAAGISTLVAVSAPTALAVDYARQAGLNLIGFARPGRHVVYHQASLPDLAQNISLPQEGGEP
jgi:FdhD protein